ncbi:MAG: cyclohexa,5-dienecarbonyl-CoA hydratase [Blastocatellia bacterium]|jgi:cyclohexa-1,5-dienecarbonyl-CoA hydratase|nr:cyclohexa,5-dienecarbonyl-CoA hydratase [Blastocatellia bacterium]
MANSYHHIQFTIDDRVARIVFARPPLNIFNIAMMREIGRAIEECISRRDLAAVLFTAAPDTKAFSAGVAIEEHVEETVYQMLDSFHAIFRSLEQLARPTIAVVEGPALGGGCELVAGCDIVIATDRARFGQPEIKLGVFPPVAAILLGRIIGEKRARELILTGDVIDADTALEYGLINHLVTAAELEQKVEGLLSKLRSLSAAGLEMTRRALDLGQAIKFDSTLTAVENLYLLELMKTDDATEGVRAFMEKRKPEWRHK